MLTALIIALAIGGIAGWLAGLLVQGTGFGLVGDIVVGILGALIARGRKALVDLDRLLKANID